LLDRDIFDLFLPEFDKPWVIHLRETCCYSTNLSTWRPNTGYKNRSMRRHQRKGTEAEKRKKGRTMESILQPLEAIVDLAISRTQNAKLGSVLIVVRLPEIN
jgi:hypothetical protein